MSHPPLTNTITTMMSSSSMIGIFRSRWTLLSIYVERGEEYQQIKHDNYAPTPTMRRVLSRKSYPPKPTPSLMIPFRHPRVQTQWWVLMLVAHQLWRKNGYLYSPGLHPFGPRLDASPILFLLIHKHKLSFKNTTILHTFAIKGAIEDYWDQISTTLVGFL